MNIFIIAAVLPVLATIFFFFWKAMQKNKIEEERRGLRRVINQVYSIRRLLTRKRVSLRTDTSTSLPTAIKQQLEAEVDFLDKKIAYCNQVIEMIEESKLQMKAWKKSYKLSQEYMNTPLFSHKYQLSYACKQFVKVIRKQDNKGLATALNKIKVNAEKDRHAEATYVHKHIQKASRNQASGIDLSLYATTEIGRQIA